MEEDNYEILARLAKCHWIITQARKMGLGPRPTEIARQDYEQMKADCLELLDQMKGGNTDENRRKLLYIVQEISKTCYPKQIRRRKKKG